jgi:TonB family protein
MSPHVDILEQPERLAKPFVGSIAFHAGLVLLAVGVTWVQRARGDFKLGDKEGGGRMGAVAVTISNIPLPSDAARINPVANDTKSEVPSPPPVKAPLKAAEKAPNPNAVPLPSKSAPQKPSWYHPELAQNNKFREKQKYDTGQLYSNQGQRLSSPNMAMPGNGGISLGGSNSPFGSQFGAYADLIVARVASKWNKPGIDARISGIPRVTVSFTLHRDGGVSDVKITQRSGVSALDASGQRAILDAAPLPPFPPGLNRNEVGIDFVFELSR